MTFDRRSLKRVALPIPIRITLEGEPIAGTTRDISSKGLCLEVPTARVKVNLAELLDQNVTLLMEPDIIAGSIKWYTVEEAVYQIGISIDKQSKAVWKRLSEEYARHKLTEMIKPA